MVFKVLVFYDHKLTIKHIDVKALRGEQKRPN